VNLSATGYPESALPPPPPSCRPEQSPFPGRFSENTWLGPVGSWAEKDSMGAENPFTSRHQAVFVK